MKMLKEKQVDFVSISEGIDTHLPTGEAYFQLMESLSAMECALIKERTLVGLHKARENGKVGGRPKSMDAPSAKSVHYIMKTKKQSNLFLINAAFRWALVISTSIYLRQMSSGCIPKKKKKSFRWGFFLIRFTLIFQQLSRFYYFPLEILRKTVYNKRGNLIFRKLNSKESLYMPKLVFLVMDLANGMP